MLDVDRAEEIYRMAGPLHRTQLSPAAQHRNQAIVAEMRTWVGVQQPNRSSALLKRCRRLIHQMREEKDTIGTDGLAALLAEAEALSERVTLSDSERKDLAKWQHHLQARREAEQLTSGSDPSKGEPVTEGRLSRSQILHLASVVRPLLEQTARGRSLTTWSDLRRRLGRASFLAFTRMIKARSSSLSTVTLRPMSPCCRASSSWETAKSIPCTGTWPSPSAGTFPSRMRLSGASGPWTCCAYALCGSTGDQSAINCSLPSPGQGRPPRPCTQARAAVRGCSSSHARARLPEISRLRRSHLPPTRCSCS